MKLFHSILFAFAGLFLCSCGDDDTAEDLPPVTPPVENNVLTLELSKPVIVANGTDATDFVVKFNNETVKEGVSIYDDNGKTYPADQSFTSTTTGKYTFWAEYKGVHSEKVTLKAVNEGNRLKMTLSKVVIEANGKDAVEFVVTYDDEPITEGVTIYDTNDEPLPSAKSFTTTEPGEYKFWAAYKTEHTKTFTVKAINVPVPVLPADPTPEKVSFAKKVFLTQFTGTDCPNCPYMTTLLRKTLEDPATAEKVLVSAAHTYNRSDPGYYSITLAQGFGVTSYPFMLVNFSKGFNYRHEITAESFRSLIDEEYNLPAEAGFTAKSELVNGKDGKKQIALHVALKAAVDGDYRLGAWLLEDQVKGHQNNANGVPGEFNIHNNVVRVADSRQGSISYSGIKLGTLSKAETAEHVFIMDLKDKWNLDNCHLVIFATKENEKTLPVVNAVSCPIEGTLPYNYAE